jgi:hypothetical protein
VVAPVIATLGYLISFLDLWNSVTTLEFNLMEAVFEVWSMFTFETMFRSETFPVMSASPTTCKLDVGPLPSTPTPRLPVVVSITVFDEAPTNVIVSTLLKSSVPWGVAMGIVSTMEGGFFKLGKAVGRDKSCGLGTLVLTKWEALWRKFFQLG